MKTLSIPLSDEEHAELTELKGNLSWRDYLLRETKIKERVKK